MAHTMFYPHTPTMSRWNRRAAVVRLVPVVETEDLASLPPPTNPPMQPPTTMPPSIMIPPPLPPLTATGDDEWEADFKKFLKIALQIGGTCPGCSPDNACGQCNLLYEKVEHIFNVGWTYGMSKQYKKRSLRAIFADISNWRRVQEACGLLVVSSSAGEASLMMSNDNGAGTTITKIVDNLLLYYCSSTWCQALLVQGMCRLRLVPTMPGSA